MLVFDAFQWKEYITFGIAVVGAVLGIANTWYSYNQRLVRLRIKPGYRIPVPVGPLMFGIEIVNLSVFTVTITDAGFTIGNIRIHRGERVSIICPIIIDGKPWPRRLEARESVSILFDPGELLVHRKRIGKAYASTACGEVAYGAGPALKQLRETVNAA